MPLGLLISLAVVAGAVAGCVTEVEPAEAWALALAAGSLSIALGGGTMRARARALGAVAVGAVMTAQGAVARDRALEPPLPAGQSGEAPDWLGEPVQVTGTLAADAETTEAGVALLVDVVSIETARGLRRVAGRVRAYVGGGLAGRDVHAWTRGRPVRLVATLRQPRVAENPGGPSPRWQALTRPYALTGSVKSAALVAVERGAIWHEAAAAVRRHVRRAVTRFVAPYDAQSAAVVTAILIGDRAGLSADVERRLQAAGTYHVIAISGGNVALVTVLCFFLLGSVCRSRRLVATLTILFVAGYGWVVGGDPSVMRAATAACLFLAVYALGLLPDPLHLFSVVAAGLVAMRPLLVIDVGAWLSFGATVGIIIGVGPLAGWATAGRLVERPLVRRFLAVPAATLLSATICAELSLLPVQANVFSRVGIAGLVLNFVAIPGMACVQVAGLAVVLLAHVFEPAGSAAGWMAHAGATALLGSARLVDYAPWLSMRVAPTPLFWTGAYYGCLAAVAATARFRRQRIVAAAGLVVAALVMLTAPTLSWAAPRPGMLRVTVLDVGQGDSILVQFPDDHALLVDAGGSAAGFDVGRRVIAPALWALGVRRLDWLLVTHVDLDHVGGAVSIVDDFQPLEIWEGIGVPASRQRAALVEAVRRHGLVWRSMRAGMRLEVGGATVDVLHPHEPDWERPAARNDDSVVFRLQIGEVDLLFTGDAGAEFESSWNAPPDLGSFRVLKAAHHGSRSSSSDAFVEAYRADVALVSAGQGNLFGHPHPEVLARFARTRAAVFRTDRDGAIIVETDGRSVVVRAMNGRRHVIGRLPEPF